MDIDTGFRASTRLVLDKVILEGLVRKCGYRTRDIMLFGFAQGGMVGLQVAAELQEDKTDGLGGVISVGGILPLSLPLAALEKKSRTPIVVCKAYKNSAVTAGAVSKLKHAFEFVEIKEWRSDRDRMPTNRDEMLPIMQFFARRLRSTRGVPTGSVELT